MEETLYELQRRKRLPEVAVKYPLEYDSLKKYRKTGVKLFIEKGKEKGSRRFRQPVAVKLEKEFTRVDIDLLNYIIESVTTAYPFLTPFTWENPSIRKVAAHLRRHRTSSPQTLASYCYWLHRFMEFVKMEPEQFISQCFIKEGGINTKFIQWIRAVLDEYQGELLACGYAPLTIHRAVTPIKTWLQVNGIDIGKIVKPRSYVKYPGRAPKPEELQKMIEVADLRGKAMISILALSGIRIGTLVKLKYKHVKDDLEAGRIPVCIHVPAELTKGKYADYFTFIGEEAVNYLKLYLEYRRRGSPSGKIPPEKITDESPLIRDHRTPRHLTTKGARKAIQDIMVKAGLRCKDGSRMHDLRPHSLRKYFKTQLTAAGVPVEYVEFMMGHKISTYLDVKMKGVEFLRRLYAASGISIRPKTKVSKVEMLKEIVRSLGYDPEKILVKEALQEPHRTTISEEEVEGALRKMIQQAIKDMVKSEKNNATSE